MQHFLPRNKVGKLKSPFTHALCFQVMSSANCCLSLHSFWPFAPSFCWFWKVHFDFERYRNIVKLCHHLTRAKKADGNFPGKFWGLQKKKKPKPTNQKKTKQPPWNSTTKLSGREIWGKEPSLYAHLELWCTVLRCLIINCKETNQWDSPMGTHNTKWEDFAASCSLKKIYSNWRRWE